MGDWAARRSVVVGLRPGRDRVRVYPRDSLRMARAVRDRAGAAGADHSAAPYAARKHALREGETRRAAAGEDLAAARAVVQRVPPTAYHDAVSRVSGLDGRQRVGPYVSEVSAGDASLVAGQRLVVVSVRRCARNIGLDRRGPDERSL